MHFLQAERIFDGERFVSDTILVYDKGLLMDLLPSKAIEGSRVEKLEGILCPGFVNAHCHLELSHLQGKIPRHTGLPGFGKAIIGCRFASAAEEIQEHMQEADRQMMNNGIVAVGDISNDASSFHVKAQSPLYYHTFVELLGLNPLMAPAIYAMGKALLQKLMDEYGLKGSLAPHAPYSTSKELMELISKENSALKLPSSIHNEESAEELKFMAGESSGFHELYHFLQLDISWWKPPGSSSLAYYGDALGSQTTLLVHNTFSSAEDIARMNSKNIFWCFCPNANLYIEDRLPQFKSFAKLEDRICLGTDSLASNGQLDLLSEANILLQHSDPGPETVLRSMTSSPAKALGISSQFGSLAKGQRSGLNLLNLKNKQLSLIKKIY